MGMGMGGYEYEAQVWQVAVGDSEGRQAWQRLDTMQAGGLIARTFATAGRADFY